MQFHNSYCTEMSNIISLICIEKLACQFLSKGHVLKMWNIC